MVEKTSAAVRVEKQYLIRYENNGSKRWDGREIFVNASWLEEIYSADELCDGAKIRLPWRGKGKKTEYWNAVLVPVNPPSLQLQQQLQWKLQAQVLASITHNNSCCLFASCTVLK